MSQMVCHIGKIELIEKIHNETLEDQCERISLERGFMELKNFYESWEEQIKDELDDELLVVKGNLYKIVSDIENNDEDIFYANKNEDGSISYVVSYYNGGCGFGEAIETAIEGIVNNS